MLHVLSNRLKTLCATNIDAHQLVFDLNPQAVDGRVTAEEFVTALQWASLGVRPPPPPPSELAQQLAAARSGLKGITARVEQNLHRALLSKTTPQCLLASYSAAEAPSPSGMHSCNSLLQLGGAAQALEDSVRKEGDAMHATAAAATSNCVLRDARALFKKCGFKNVAELFLFVQTCPSDDAHDDVKNATGASGSQFACFARTKVQILTPRMPRERQHKRTQHTRLSRAGSFSRHSKPYISPNKFVAKTWCTRCGGRRRRTSSPTATLCSMSRGSARG